MADDMQTADRIDQQDDLQNSEELQKTLSQEGE
jgi:hypothetical protein